MQHFRVSADYSSSPRLTSQAIDLDVASKSPIKHKKIRSPSKRQNRPKTQEIKAQKPTTTQTQPKSKRPSTLPPNPLRPIPLDSSLRRSQISTSISGKINFIVDQVVTSHEDDNFIIFSEAPLALLGAATTLRSVGAQRCLLIKS